MCQAFGPPESLVLTEIDEPSPGPHQVVIDVEVASLNFPDLLTIKGMYQIRPEPPFSPGFEAVGVVSSVGDKVTWPQVGDRVAAVGVVGAFAEKWAVDAAMCVPVPTEIPAEVAASIVIAYGTSYHALKQRAALKKGETLLVLGAAGGVGSAAIEIGVMMGATVIAAASSDEKLEFCRDLGATDVINYRTEDLKTRTREITGGRGADVIYDPVGGDFSEQAFRAIAWNGRHLVIGFTAGDIPRLPLNLALLKGASIVGVFWGSFAQLEPDENRRNMEELMGHIVEGRLQPRVTSEFPIEGYLDAYNLVTNRKALGKVVLRIAG
jgi:NADPH2:quinone reductase